MSMELRRLQLRGFSYVKTTVKSKQIPQPFSKRGMGKQQGWQREELSCGSLHSFEASVPLDGWSAWGCSFETWATLAHLHAESLKRENGSRSYVRVATAAVSKIMVRVIASAQDHLAGTWERPSMWNISVKCRFTTSPRTGGCAACGHSLGASIRQGHCGGQPSMIQAWPFIWVDVFHWPSPRCLRLRLPREPAS